MIIRIVRMTFQTDKTEAFLDLFNRSRQQIIEMEGCLHLELWRDTQEPNVFVTHSHWVSEDALNNYRASELFGNVWKETKVLFSEKPVAFSVEKVS
ncbi:putative quinol monooxygenase [Dyadobacter sp. CY312]|uniref:putative quinol monooxygenase n=1 Tax=Dyadobacter sp. CY312 TaxID=2907303 RepID=UPI001F2849DD|nr:antibiotic biosynthesis monooxygenase family protein [Dyadobacter sp. CY312]MCE7041312.1 antibiotic biosynthesis monooxygenase [Dyadobacter sp. CY312]